MRAMDQRKISANLSGISYGGFGGIKDDKVYCERELWGIMGLRIPHMTSPAADFAFISKSHSRCACLVLND